MAMAMGRSKARRRQNAGSERQGSRNARGLLPLSALLPAFLAGPASAAQWVVVPTLSVSETYTDNVTLAPPGSQRSDWITQVVPGVSVAATGARLRLSAAYSAQFLNRANEGTTDLFHQLNARGDAELVQHVLFVDASSTVSQQNTSILGPQADSNVNTTGNRATVRTFLISPYLRHAFGTQAQGEARLTYSTVSTGSSSSLSNSQSTGINLNLGSGPSFRLYTWNLTYSKEIVDHTQGVGVASPNVETERITAFGRRLLTPTVAVISTVGYEDNSYLSTGPAPKGISWSTGLEWTPTDRTRLVATTGKRYFGSNRALNFSHRTRLTVWSLNYTEDVTTTRQQFLVPSNVDTAGLIDSLFISTFPDPVLRRAAVQTFITQNGLPASLSVPVNFLTDVPFVVKGWRGSVGILGIRNTLLADVFTQTRESTGGTVAGGGDFALGSTSKSSGLSLVWTSRLSNQLASNLTAGYTRNEFPSLNREDNVKFVRFNLTKQFQPRLSGSLDYRWLQNDSNQGGAGFTENAVTAAVSMRF